MRRTLAIVLLAITLTACTPEELMWYASADDDAQKVAIELIVREQAGIYGVDPDLLVRIIDCESGMNPLAVNRSSGALGLSQQLPRYWPGRAEALGYSPDDWALPRVNAAVAAWMLSTQGTRPWAASRSCWS